ncbi:interleukin 17-like protein [Argonauta hians]
MNIKNVVSLIGIIFFNVISIFPTDSIPINQCQVPTNLRLHYETLLRAANGNKFLLPVEMVPSENTKEPQTLGEKTCPHSSSFSDIIRERSTCPWYLNITYDSTIYPPTRSEVVCRCKNCLDANENHQCVTVYTKMTVLKRTRECVGGLYVYEPSVIDVATACVCAHKVNRISNPDDGYAS